MESRLPEDFVLFESQSDLAQSMYDKRAPSYDASWHPSFAKTLMEMTQCQPGNNVLDLACGTGLCTVEAVQAVGLSGSVIGLDVSSGMLREAQQKVAALSQTYGGPVNAQLVKHDICDLPAVRELRNKEQYFDRITAASCLVLLEDPTAALTQWSQYLKPSGRLIFDVPYPQNQLGGALMEKAVKSIGLRLPYNRGWVTGIEACRDLVENIVHPRTGEKQFRVLSIVPVAQQGFGERFYSNESAESFFDESYIGGVRMGVFNSLQQLSTQGMARLKAAFIDEFHKLAEPRGVREVDGVWVLVAEKL